MRNNWMIITCVVFAAAFAAMFISLRAEQAQRAQLNSVTAARAKLADQIREFHELSARQPDAMFGAQPEAEFEKSVRACIQASRLNPRTRYSTRAGSDVAHSNQGADSTTLRKRSATVEMAGLSPSQIGSFLVHWRDSQHVWIPERIQLLHDQRSGKNMYSLRLECSVIYHAEGRK